MKRFSGDPVFRFYYGVALVLEGRTQEGIRELDPLQQYSEVNVCLSSFFTFITFKLTYTQILQIFKFDVIHIYKTEFNTGDVGIFIGFDSRPQAMFDCG